MASIQFKVSESLDDLRLSMQQRARSLVYGEWGAEKARFALTLSSAVIFTTVREMGTRWNISVPKDNYDHLLVEFGVHIALAQTREEALRVTNKALEELLNFASR